MATGPSTPQVSNVYIPNWEASGKLTVGFSRNPKKFFTPALAQFVRTPKLQGFYLKFTNQESGRFVSGQLDADGQDLRSVWPDGTNAPQPIDEESFRWVPFEAKRRAYSYSSGYLAKQMSDFNLLELKRVPKAKKLMTQRDIRVATLLTTTTNWAASTDLDLASDHFGTATAIGGGKLDSGTETQPNIQIAFNSVASKITLDTMGEIESEPERFTVVMNPNDARKIATSPELKAFLKGSPDAEKQITGNLHPNARYGLPASLYGFDIKIVTSVKVTNPKGATLARSFVWPDASVVMLAKPSSLEGVYGEGSFSTLTIFYYTDGAGEDVAGMDIAVEEFDDPENKLWKGRCLEHTKEVLTCPASGFLLTSATG